MYTTRTLASAAILFGSVATIGCTSSTPTTTETTAASSGTVAVAVAANETCPIMGKPVKENGGRSEWNGQTIGFCCPKCIDKWEGLSEDEKTSHLADAGSDAHGSDQDHTDYAGH